MAATEHPSSAQRIVEVLESDGFTVTVVTTPDGTCVPTFLTPPQAVVVACDPMDSPAADRLRSLRDRLPGTAMVIVTRSPKSASAGIALGLGVKGVVIESQIETTLSVVVSAASAGHVCVPAQLRGSLLRPDFSHRERQTLGLAVAGHTNAQIAGALFLSESTVKSHLASAFRKLGVQSRKEAASVILDPAAGLAASVLGAARGRPPGIWRPSGPAGAAA